MKKSNPLTLVRVSEMPKGGPCPCDDPMALYKLGLEMESVCKSNNGVGLAAVQVGVPYNFFVTVLDGKTQYWVDCSYEGSGGWVSTVEGCLSLLGKDGKPESYSVKRHRTVHLAGKRLVVEESSTAPTLVDFSEKFEGGMAIILQHEIDHAHGTLISHIGEQVFFFRS